MSYSDLLARQDKELERLNQEYFADQATIRQLQKDHYDRSRFDGQLDRLRELHEKKIKDVQTRFAKEQRAYLGEPEPAPDISQNQDKAADMIQSYRRQQAETNTDRHLEEDAQQPKQATIGKNRPVDEEEVKKLAQKTREQREQKNYQRRRGFKR